MSAPFEQASVETRPAFENVWEEAGYRIVLALEEEPRPQLHPAIDIYQNQLVISAPLPVRIITPEGDEIMAEEACYITSDRKILRFKDLSNNGVIIKYPPTWLDRWSLDGIRRFLLNGWEVGRREIYNRILGGLIRHFEFYDDREYDLETLWIIHTYFRPIWETCPYLAIGGAPNVGKTKNLQFLAMLCFNGLLSLNISLATVYRLTESLGATLMFDEAESLSSVERRQEIRTILHGGYKKGLYVFRTGKTKNEQLVPERYDVFGAKAFVSYSGLEDILTQRSIPITMVRSSNPSILNSRLSVRDSYWQETRDMLYCFALCHWQEIYRIYERMREESVGIEGRDREVWEPILVLADYFNADVEPYRRVR
jgi:hypothetical protein